MRRVAMFTVAACIATGVVACGGSQDVACAGSIGGGRPVSGGGGGAKSGGASSGGAKSGSPSGAKPASGGQSKSAPGAPKTPPPRNQSQTKAAAASKPTSKPDPADVAKARTSAPPRVTRGGSYYSEVTGNTYVYNDISYYRRPGYVLDIYDPYNRWNYWYMPMSPFYGRPFMMADSCDGGDHEEQRQDVNITINSDGKVMDVKDAPPGQGTVVTDAGAR